MIKEYVIKDLFGILVIVSENVIKTIEKIKLAKITFAENENENK